MAKKQNFEDKLKKLDLIVNKIEDNSLSLDDSIAKFKEGMELANECQKLIINAEQEIETVIAEGKGLKTEKFALNGNTKSGDE